MRSLELEQKMKKNDTEILNACIQVKNLSYVCPSKVVSQGRLAFSSHSACHSHTALCKYRIQCVQENKENKSNFAFYQQIHSSALVIGIRVHAGETLSTASCGQHEKSDDSREVLYSKSSYDGDGRKAAMKIVAKEHRFFFFGLCNHSNFPPIRCYLKKES